MKKFSLKVLGAALFGFLLAVTTLVAPVNAATTASWNGTAPTFSTGLSPAMNIDFVPNNGSATYRNVALSIRDASGNNVPSGVTTDANTGNCKLTSLTGTNVTNSNFCNRFNSGDAGGSRIAYSVSPSSTGSFNLQVQSGVFGGLTNGSYSLWVAIMDDSTLVESALISFTIGAPVQNQNHNQNQNQNQNQNYTPCQNGTGPFMVQAMGNGGRNSGGGGDCMFRSAQASTVAPANVFTRTGYTFAGWRTAQNVSVAVGDSVTATQGAPLQLFAVWTAGVAVNNTPRPIATLGLGVPRGSRVHTAPAPVVASGLQPNAPYSVEVHSTPVIIATGNVASDGTVNFSASIPSGLEAGWHTMIFTSTAADGSTFTSNYYFKVAGDGSLLATSETLPAELAQTGFDAAPYLFGGLALALTGGALMLIARRKQSN